MDVVDVNVTAVDVPNQFVEIRSRRLAYRSIRRRHTNRAVHALSGNMDLCDPLFLDSLAGAGLRVIIFDYSGLGLSTGERTYDPVALARDAKDLTEALGFERVVIGGWSLLNNPSAGDCS